jgi:hypothetical protein
MYSISLAPSSAQISGARRGKKGVSPKAAVRLLASPDNNALHSIYYYIVDDGLSYYRNAGYGMHGLISMSYGLRFAKNYSNYLTRRWRHG